MGDPFRVRLSVRFGDIDRAGIVYYPRFLHYFHVAMEEYFRERLGRNYAEVLDSGFGLPTVHIETDFKNPLRYGDHIEVEVEVESIGESSMTWRYRVVREDDRVTAAEARIVTVGLDLEAYEKRPIPDWLRDAVSSAQQDSWPLTPGP